MARTLNSNVPQGSSIQGRYQRGDIGGLGLFDGVFIARVRSVKDDKYQGDIFVEILGQQTLFEDNTPPENWIRCRRLSPFGGSIKEDEYTNNYGFSCSPPAVGSEVLVAFTGREQYCFLLGVLGDMNRNAQVPGLPASKVEGETGIGATVESTTKQQNTNPDRRQPHHINGALGQQGIGVDSVRGVSSSGSRRESPTRVTGWNTPGGHSIVFDDGTINTEDNLTPDEGRQDGLSCNIRIRSQGGAQVLLNDSAGIFYLINQNGSGWIQMDSNGNIDIYGEGSISYHAEKDFNIHAGGNLNIDADDINVKSRGSDGIKFESATGAFNVHANKDIRLTTDLNGHIKCKGTMRISTDGMLDLNGPPAQPANKTVNNNHTANTTVKQSVSGRVPEHEPWGGHEESQDAIAIQAPSSQTNTSDKDVKPSQIVGQTQPKPKTQALGASQRQDVNPRTGRPF